jgi:uncharacterized membrane protein
MSDRSLRAALVGLCIAGAGISGYVLYSRWTSSGLVCSTGGCETVQSSDYATFLGVPIAALGLGGYFVVGLLALAAGPLARAAVAVLALAATTFSAYLLVVQLAVIEAVCDWCVASDVISTLITVVALVRLLAPGGSQAGSTSSSPWASA